MNKGFVMWLTGLPGSGKTTLARRLQQYFLDRGKNCEVLDGDEIRKTISPDLGFSQEERTLHNKRVIHFAKILQKNDIIVIVSLISPYKKVRNLARTELSPRFAEIYVNCSLEVCIKRDPKGLYKKALEGEIKKMTGLSDTYESPESPELILNTDKEEIEESMGKILAYIEPKLE